ASTTLPLGWWLGARRQSAREVALKSQLDALHEKQETVYWQYAGILDAFVNTATDMFRRTQRGQS
ncbi:MAG: hypothetical protein ACRDYA_13475, partial [Egibacteraceae bacterium]